MGKWTGVHLVGAEEEATLALELVAELLERSVLHVTETKDIAAGVLVQALADGGNQSLLALPPLATGLGQGHNLVPLRLRHRYCSATCGSRSSRQLERHTRLVWWMSNMKREPSDTTWLSRRRKWKETLIGARGTFSLSGLSEDTAGNPQGLWVSPDNTYEVVQLRCSPRFCAVKNCSSTCRSSSDRFLQTFPFCLPAPSKPSISVRPQVCNEK